MKIERFNLINEALKSTTKTYIDEFSNNVGNDIPDWILEVSSITNLKEYKNINKFKFAEKKGFKKYCEYLNMNSEILKLMEQIVKLEKLKDKIQLEASNEVLYKFQEELLEKDFSSFYKIFIEDVIDDEEEFIENLESYDIHPEIFKKYKDDILMKLKTIKYNL